MNRIAAGGTFVIVMRDGTSLVVGADSKVTSALSTTSTMVKIQRLGSHCFFSAIGNCVLILEKAAQGYSEVFNASRTAESCFSSSLGIENVAHKWGVAVVAALTEEAQSGDDELSLLGIFGDVRGPDPVLVTSQISFDRNRVPTARTDRIELNNFAIWNEGEIVNPFIAGTSPQVPSAIVRFKGEIAARALTPIEAKALFGQYLVQHVIDNTPSESIGGSPSVLIAEAESGTRWFVKAPISR